MKQVQNLATLTQHGNSITTVALHGVLHTRLLDCVGHLLHIPDKKIVKLDKYGGKSGNGAQVRSCTTIFSVSVPKKHSKNLKEYWDEDESRQGFGYREDFERFTPEKIDFTEQDQKIEKSLKKI